MNTIIKGLHRRPKSCRVQFHFYFFIIRLFNKFSIPQFDVSVKPFTFNMINSTNKPGLECTIDDHVRIFKRNHGKSRRCVFLLLFNCICSAAQHTPTNPDCKGRSEGASKGKIKKSRFDVSHASSNHCRTFFILIHMFFSFLPFVMHFVAFIPSLSSAFVFLLLSAYKCIFWVWKVQDARV